MFYLKKSFFLIHHVLFVFHSLFKNVANAQSESILYNDSMDNGPFEQSSGYGLAIEMSCSQGSVTLCHNDLELDTLSIPQPHRHAIELMPTIDQLCKRHQVGPKQIGEIYVSIGPGSFTGLRIAVATAKLFASVVGSRLVTVPTIDVVAENAPQDRLHVAVCLNTKRNQMYAAVYRRANGNWRKIMGPDLMTPSELCARGPSPLAVLGERLPDYGWPTGVECLDTTLAVPNSRMVWRLGRQLAKRGEFVDTLKFLPLYARAPEAVELWKKRNHGQETN